MEESDRVIHNRSFNQNRFESLSAHLNQKNIYQIITQIGQGYFGEIFKAINKENQNEVALKIIENDGSKWIQQTIENEKRVFMLIQNQQNIVKCYKIQEIELDKINYTIFELELCEYDLLYLINQQKVNQKPFSEEFKYKILKSIINALYQLQNMKIIHSDLKASNILISDDQIKLTDFGLSVLNNNNNDYSDFYCGQTTLCSPEKSSYFSFETDLFSLGLIILMMDNPIQFNYESNKNLDKYWLQLRKGVIPDKLNLERNSFYFQVSQQLIQKCPIERRRLFEELKLKVNINKENLMTLESYQNFNCQYNQLKQIQQSEKNDHLTQQIETNYLENDTFIYDLKSTIKDKSTQNIFIDIRTNDNIFLSDFLNLKDQIIQYKITRLVINLHYQNLEDDFLQIVIDIVNKLPFLKNFEFYNEGNTKFSSIMQGQDKKLVWLDCDPGADDAMAIFLAAYSDQIKLLGISTVHGNSSIEKVTNNALKVLKMGGIQGIPVYRGLEQAIVRRDKINIQFHGESGIDGCVLPDTEQEAIQDDVFHKIYHTLKNQSQKVHFVATGAYSNLAILLTIYPDVKNYIEQISLMGGAVFLGNQTPAAEFNIMSDPEAAQIVFQSGLKITLATIDLTHKVRVTQEIIEKIELYKSEFGKNVIGFLTYYMGRYKQRYGWDYAPLHDPVSVFYIINPDAFSTKFRNVEIDTVSPFCLGRTVVDEYRVTERQPNCYVAYEINKELFWQEMLNTLSQANKNSPMK